MADRRITVIFGIDMETDVGSYTPFYEGVKNGTPRLLELFAKKNILGTFFFTGEAARENPEIVDLVDKSGNEVGCHSLYHETVGNELFPIPGLKPLLPEEVPLRLAKATEWVEETLGRRPLSFRCPRLWGSTAVVDSLEALGYQADASYPLYFFRQRLVPYHPDRTDWTVEGSMRILEIPNFADMTMESKDPGLERDRDQWPLFRTLGAAKLMQRIVRHIEFVQNQGLPVVLCFYFHPWEFIPCKKRYHFGEASVMPDRFIVKNTGERALRELGVLVDQLTAIGASFTRADRLAASWG